MPVNYQLGKIYKVVNNVNNIIYIGSTAQKLLSTRMGGHRRDSGILTNTSKWSVALRTIGAQNFTILLIHPFPCNSKDELEAEEYRVLDAEIAAGTPVYNTVIAGKQAAETVAKRAAAYVGFRHTAETKIKMGQSHIGFRHTSETKAKMAQSQTGRITSESTKKKLSESKKGNMATFNFGCVCYVARLHLWMFVWKENKEQKRKSFGAHKYGYWQAKLLCEAERKRVYPEWQTDEEKALEQFGNIDLN